MKPLRRVRQEQGFTLIEMIGVLAVIAVLAAFLLPKVFEVIAESKARGVVAAIHTYEVAITKYYMDIGSVLPLDADGKPTEEQTGDSAVATSLAARLTLSASDELVLSTNLWPKFHGPYVEKFDTNQPPDLGTQMYVPASGAADYGTVVSSTSRGWDLKGDDEKSDLPTGANVVYLKLTGLSESDFLLVDAIVDSNIGNSQAEKRLRGRAQWYSVDGGTLYMYLAHR